MSPTKLTPSALALGLLLLFAGLGVRPTLAEPQQQPGPAAPIAEKTISGRTGLTEAEFQQLKPILDLNNQPWARLPWKYTITEARKAAAAARKPIFMLVDTGNPLGCT